MKQNNTKNGVDDLLSESIFVLTDATVLGLP